VILKSRINAQREKNVPDNDRELMLMSRYDFLRNHRLRMQFWDLTLQRQGYYNDRIYFVQNHLKEMNNFLKARGIPLYVLIFPIEFQVNPDLFDEIVTKFSVNRYNIHLKLGQIILKDILDSGRIPYIDLLEPFREAAKKKRLYGRNDSH
jgi:hypothetical protein